MRFAYADPPYIGQAAKHYRHRPDYGGEVDHTALIARLVTEWPDGWALSCSSPSLRFLLPLCPENVRVGAWVKPFAIYKPNVNPGYCWEPVIFCGGRKRGRARPTVADYVSAVITLKRDVVGAKPGVFCFWLFEMLGCEACDTLDDLFPGSGAVTQAWERFQRQVRLERSTESCKQASL